MAAMATAMVTATVAVAAMGTVMAVATTAQKSTKRRRQWW
jgi:hypothetical protein